MRTSGLRIVENLAMVSRRMEPPVPGCNAVASDSFFDGLELGCLFFSCCI